VRRDEAERLLAGLGAAYDRIAAGMFAVDGHPGLVLLRGGKLTGETEARARAVRPEVDLLWAHFTLLGNLLGRARDLCARRRATDEEWADLERLLGGPVVLLDPAGMPLDGPGTVAQRLRLADLAEQVERRCAGVTAHLSEVDTAWTVVAGRLARDAEAADGLTALAKTLGQPEAMAGVGRALAEISALDVADPLSAAPGGRIGAAAGTRFDRLEAELAAVRTRLSELDGLRQAYPRRVDELRALVSGVAQAEQAVAQAYRHAAEKIADPGLAPLPTAAAVLTTRLAELDRLCQSGQWSRLAADLSTVEDSARRSVSRAAELRALADGLVERRDELRGRLSAYREKAARHGFAEDEDLSARYDRARELLYTAPCDLRAGTRAVFDYQTAIARLLSEGGIRHG
jgi:hypothetical protein